MRAAKIKIEYVLATIILVTMVTGLSLGYVFYGLFNAPAENCIIKYVSQEEIMELEKARVGQDKINPNQQNLFFGKPEEAASIALKLSKRYENRNTRVIYSVSKIFSKRAQSISWQVHEEIIRQLKAGGSNE